QIVNSEEAAVGVLSEDGESLRSLFRCTSREGVVAGNDIQTVVQGILRELVKQRRSLRLNDADELLMQSDSPFDSISSFLGAPIFSEAKVCGWIYLINKLTADEFSEADQRLAETLATQVSI